MRIAEKQEGIFSIEFFEQNKERALFTFTVKGKVNGAEIEKQYECLVREME